MLRTRKRQISLAIILLFTVCGIVRHLSGGDDLSASYFGCRVLAAGEPSHLYSHSAVDFSAVDDPVWHALAKDENFLPPVGYIHPFVQTPLLVFGLEPLCSRLTFVTFNRIFIVLVVLSVSGTLLLVLHFWTPILFQPLPVLLICAIFYRAEPLRYALALTQTQPIFLLLSLIAILLARRNRPIAAGVLLAIAASVKLTPAFLVLYWLVDRKFKAAISFVISYAAILAVTILAVGTPLTLTYLRELSELSNVLLVSYNNQSLAATWMTHNFPAKELLAFHMFRLPPAVKVTAAVMTAIASLAGGWLDWKNAARQLPPYGAMFAMVAATIFTPIAWTHYFVLLLVPALFLIAAALEERRALWLLLALPIVVLNIYPVGTDVFKWTAASRFVIRPDFYAGLLSLLALGWLALSKSFSRQLDVPTS